MKRLVPLLAAGLAVVVFFSAAMAAPARAKTKIPDFESSVVDAAGVVPDDAEQRIAAALDDYRRRTGNQIAVAVVKTTGDDSLEDYTIDLAREWGVGTKGKDNGVVLLIAYDDRKLRIEVGRGLEGELTDLESGRIIREQIVPRMREGDVAGAIEAGTQAIRAALGDPLAAAPAPVAAPAEPDSNAPPIGFLVPLVIFSVVSMATVRYRRRRPDWMSPWVYGALMASGSGSSSSGGSSFGGFSGGGGGSFGGGGASGSW